MHLSADLLIVIPCLDEEAHLSRLIAGILCDPLATNMTLVVADGGSRDRSREIVTEISSQTPQVVLMDNPKKLQSAGVNLAVRRFGADSRLTIRVDAHARYPDDFISRLVQTQARTEAHSVVVSMHTVGVAPKQQAIAIAQNSIFGTGGSAHRSASEGAWVDHGHHALFLTKTFLDLGGYDEDLSHNEDAEYDMRLAAAGGKVYLAPVVIDYLPRDTIRGLWRQYFNFGKGRARTAVMHRKTPNLRRGILILLVPALLIAALGFWTPLALAPACGWLGVVVLFAAIFAAKHGLYRGIMAAVAGGTMQLAWSLGYHVQLFEEFRRVLRLAPRAS